MAIRVICADDRADIVDMWRIMIEREEDMECILCAQDAQLVLDHLEKIDTSLEHSPIVVLLDYVMPGLDPMEALQLIAQRYATVRVLMCSGHDEDLISDDAIEAGAWGVVSKHQGLAAVLNAVRRVSRGEFALSQTP